KSLHESRPVPRRIKGRDDERDPAPDGRAILIAILLFNVGIHAETLRPSPNCAGRAFSAYGRLRDGRADERKEKTMCASTSSARVRMRCREGFVWLAFLP